ncbi:MULTISPECIES: MarR family transcriptional regulator [Gammaproteobacteria]|uniref:MarR family transcriptional regulator n=1 Tax=Gammaproteobacteria TaxID=1236 RepID=UPI001C5800BF|nr:MULTISPECIES: helix-turn-helix domain-containing protein [Gammaproteobacteria]MCV4173001.1 LuxR family transcriptional regulator [Pseudomonas aeruginosa]
MKKENSTKFIEVLDPDVVIFIHDDCSPAVAEALQKFQERWRPYSTASRHYPIVGLIREVIDPAVATYMTTLPARYSSFVPGAGTGTDFSEIIRLVGLDAMVRLQRELLRRFIKTVDRQDSRDRRFIGTLESLAGLALSCACKRPKKAALRGLNGTRSRSFCRFCGKPAGLKSFADDDSQTRGNDDKLRLSSKYCADHQPLLSSGASNLAYRRAKRSVAQFDMELDRLNRQCANRGKPKAASGDPLVDRYFHHYLLAQTVQPADKGELRNQARLMVDSKLSDHKKQILVLQRDGFNQSQIGRRLGIERQAVSKALKSLASIPRMLQLKE